MMMIYTDLKEVLGNTHSDPGMQTLPAKYMHMYNYMYMLPEPNIAFISG